jgi:hypothetical protein
MVLFAVAGVTHLTIVGAEAYRYVTFDRCGEGRRDCASFVFIVIGTVLMTIFALLYTAAWVRNVTISLLLEFFFLHFNNYSETIPATERSRIARIN